MSRSKVLQVRLSEDEMQLLEKVAGHLKQPKSRVARQVILRAIMPPPEATVVGHADDAKLSGDPRDLVDQIETQMRYLQEMLSFVMEREFVERE